MAVASSCCESLCNLWRAACSPRKVYFLVRRSLRSCNHISHASANSFDSKGNTTPSLLDVLSLVLSIVLVCRHFGDADSSFWRLCPVILAMLPVLKCRTRPLNSLSNIPSSTNFLTIRWTVLGAMPYSSSIVWLDLWKVFPLPVNESTSAKNAFSQIVSRLSSHISAGIQTPLKLRSMWER